MVAQKPEMSSIRDILTARAPFLTLARRRVRQKLRAHDEEAARRKMTTLSRHSGRIDPISVSTTPFCQVDRAEIGRSRISNESVAVGVIAIMNDKAWWFTPPAGFGHLTGNPLSGRMRGHTRPQKFPDLAQKPIRSRSAVIRGRDGRRCSEFVRSRNPVTVIIKIESRDLDRRAAFGRCPKQ
jgi:hypothetical protein